MALTSSPGSSGGASSLTRLQEALRECVEQGHVDEDDVQWILECARDLASRQDPDSADLLSRSAASFELLATDGPDAIDPDALDD